MVRGTVAAFAVLTACSFAGAQEPAASDIDLLLTLLGQGGVVNNEYVSISNDSIGESWLREFQKLSARPAPRGREIADALKRLKPVTDDIQAALADEKKTRELNVEVRSKLRCGDAVTPVVLDSLFGLSAEQLNQMEAKGGDFEQQAEEYRRRRAEAQVFLVKTLGQQATATYGPAMASQARIHRLKARSEALRHAVVRRCYRPAPQRWIGCYLRSGKRPKGARSDRSRTSLASRCRCARLRIGMIQRQATLRLTSSPTAAVRWPACFFTAW